MRKRWKGGDIVIKTRADVLFVANELGIYDEIGAEMLDEFERGLTESETGYRPVILTLYSIWRGKKVAEQYDFAKDGELDRYFEEINHPNMIGKSGYHAVKFAVHRVDNKTIAYHLESSRLKASALTQRLMGDFERWYEEIEREIKEAMANVR